MSLWRVRVCARGSALPLTTLLMLLLTSDNLLNSSSNAASFEAASCRKQPVQTCRPRVLLRRAVTSRLRGTWSAASPASPKPLLSLALVSLAYADSFASSSLSSFLACAKSGFEGQRFSADVRLPGWSSKHWPGHLVGRSPASAGPPRLSTDSVWTASCRCGNKHRGQRHSRLNTAVSYF